MLYACGSNGQGQLGLAHQNDMNQWTEVPLKIRGPVQIAGGGNHTLLLDLERGIALVTLESRFIEIDHPHNQKWKLVSAGWDFYVLVDASSRIWHAKINTERVEPLKEITHHADAEIEKIESGLSHTVFKTTSGSLYGWGASRKGQAGLEQPFMNEPTKFDTLLPVVDFSCGKDFTALVLSDSSLELRGNKRWFPELPNTAAASGGSRVQCGWSTLAVEGGGIWGNNSHNQLDMPKNCSLFVLGSEHGVFADSGGIVGTWGWGEHGNCPGPQRFDGKIQIFAGCATSFVNTYNKRD